MTESRPVLVTIIGALMILSGILVLLASIVFFYAGTQDLYNLGLDAGLIHDLEQIMNESHLTWQGLMSTFGIITLVPAVLNLLAGIGLIRGWRLMWYLGVILSGLGIIATIILIIQGASSGLAASIGGNIVGLVINGFVFFYLLQYKVKSYFGV